MSGGSWTHLASRPFVRPLIGTWVRPNHLTTLRLISGLAAGGLLAIGTKRAIDWGGAVWLVSAFADRADGELARLGQLQSPAGHAYDFYSDFAVNTCFFVCAGIGLRGSWLHAWAIPLGVLTGAMLLGASICAERIERHSPPGTRAISGRWGFHPDDALYLMAPIAWLGWLAPTLIGAAFGSATLMLVTGLGLLRLLRRT